LVQVHDGHSVISPAMLNKLVTGLRQSPGTPAASTGMLAPNKPLQELEKLSPREKGIFFLVAKSLSNKQIARDLDIAETTVKIHIQHIFKKMNLTSRVQIAIFAAGNGLS
jgi:two-component system nitrate/nitrite response regulator NarL